MEAASESKRRTRIQKSCGECRRRKQKCIIVRYDAPCVNCSRRYPPVECVISRKDAHGSKSTAGFEEQILTFELSSMTEVPNNVTGLVLSRERSAGSSRASPQRSPDELPIRSRDPTKRVAGIVASSPGVAGFTRADDDGQWAVSLVGRATSLILDGRGDPNAILPFGGLLSEVNCLNSFPINQTVRNMELLHFYLRVVAPNLVSIDGESQPVVFLKAIMPWQLQSPLMPTIGMLMASTTQSLEKGLELDRNSEALAIKSRVLIFINQYLRGEFNSEVAAEVVKCIINLVVMEWFWGADDSMWAHLRGLKEIIRYQGGLRLIRDVVGENVLILTDYEIACCFERELFLQHDDPVLDEPILMPTSFPLFLDCPLTASAGTFESNRKGLGLSSAVANILDDVRFLTLSITSAAKTENSLRKIQTTASWLHARLLATSAAAVAADATEDDLILATVRCAALVYSWSIKSLIPISHVENDAVQKELYSNMRAVSLGRWKHTPGIFLWIMLVAAPSSSGADAKGRFIRRKMAVAGLSIGFEDFNVGISYIRAFWLVQRWIASEGGDALA